ncbi:MAG TPA: 3-dehydroquinate synthase II, partial [Candidatus Methanoperedenaceae archaeon]|nr:3-dehydroquinate synthase II [Candidatus Methanoperedenaceae archaeon]
MTGKLIWIKADTGSWKSKKTRVTAGLESGADCVLAESGDIARVRELGNIKVAAGSDDADIIVVGKGGEGDGTMPLPQDAKDSQDIRAARELKQAGKTVAGFVIIKNKKYEQFAVELGKLCDFIIVIGTDWKVIPL